jgi:hypothetical protein
MVLTDAAELSRDRRSRVRPATGSPAASNPANSNATMTIARAATETSRAANVSPRLTGSDRTSSLRPDCSSPPSAPAAAIAAQTAITTAKMPPTLHACTR